MTITGSRKTEQPTASAKIASQTNYLISPEFFIGSQWKQEFVPKFANPKKYFIYRCPCHGLCGGYGDREKGMVAAYIISLLSNRSFGIEHKCPGDITKYLRPNKVDWIVTKDKIKGLKTRMHSVIDNWGYIAKVKNMNFNEYYKEDVIYWTGNNNYIESLRQHKEVPKLIPGMRNMSTSDVYRNVLNVLFKPTESFQKQISTFTDKVASNYLTCAQIRVGKNPSMPSDAVQGRFVQSHDLKSVWKFLNENIGKKSKLFIASDSMGVKNEARKMFPDQIIDTPGPIVHVDRLRGASGNREEGFMKVVLEQLILSHCSTLLVSRSGYSFLGAYLRKDSNNLYCIANGNVTACKREELLKYYSMR